MPTDPLDPALHASLRHWEPVAHAGAPAIVDCGWGRLLLGQTFPDPPALVAALAAEGSRQRDVAMYVRDPHVVVALAPQRLFLDPSHTYRLPLLHDTPRPQPRRGWTVRAARPDDADAIARILQRRGMVPPKAGFLAALTPDGTVQVLVAEDSELHAGSPVVGVVTGVDHVAACGDGEGGSSLWSLAVDPQCLRTGVGLSLTLEIAQRFRARGRRYLDLSVMHDNVEAIRLNEKVGFRRVPVYCVKNRNPINERLYVGPERDEGLNVYAQIIVDEARRRGIQAEVVDAPGGCFRLSLGAAWPAANRCRH